MPLYVGCTKKPLIAFSLYKVDTYFLTTLSFVYKWTHKEDSVLTFHESSMVLGRLFH